MKIIEWSKLTETEKLLVLQRPAQEENLVRREQVRKIISRVKKEKDAALFDLTKQFDKASMIFLQVTEDEFKNAEKAVIDEDKQAIQFAIERITNYQKALNPKNSRVQTYEGVICERHPRAIESVGLYVPGGNTPLVSTVMMLAIPARIAGCQIRVLCTPPQANGSINPALLLTAKRCGIDTIYKVGGAQAIAAMAFGTESIPKVDKIYGPGNAWVTEAKRQASNDRDGALCDMPAGPSEVFIIADENAKAEFVAADLLAQAEHGIDSQVFVVTVSNAQAIKINTAIQKQIRTLSRSQIADQSLRNGRVIIAESINEAILISNRYAPEHLILQIKDPEFYCEKIKNAGAVFLGEWSPETLGDYTTGSNHVLPTDGYAKCVSGLSVMDFIKYISFQTATKAGIENIGESAIRIADIEKLDAHKQAVLLRLKYLEKDNE